MRLRPSRDFVRLLGKRLLLADLWLALKALALLPPRVAWFYVRAHLLAQRQRDAFSLLASARPEDLSKLLALAKGRECVVPMAIAQLGLDGKLMGRSLYVWHAPAA